MVKTLIKSVCAGVAISIGALIYLTLRQTSILFAALFFSVGLLIILWYRFDLYTGKIGYINSPKEIPIMLIILLGNFIGCGAMFFVSGSAVGTVAAAIMAHKYQIDLYELFIRSVFCGILIYVAVDQFKHINNKIAPFIAVPAFVLAETEHCIANTCYIIAGLAFEWYTIPFMLTVILGNAIGSIIFHQITRRITK